MSEGEDVLYKVNWDMGGTAIMRIGADVPCPWCGARVPRRVLEAFSGTSGAKFYCEQPCKARFSVEQFTWGPEKMAATRTKPDIVKVKTLKLGEWYFATRQRGPNGGTGPDPIEIVTWTCGYCNAFLFSQGELVSVVPAECSDCGGQIAIRAIMPGETEARWMEPATFMPLPQRRPARHRRPGSRRRLW